MLVIEMIGRVEEEQRQAAETTAPQTVQLSQLRGIGLTIASVMTNEVFFRDFQNRREVAGYLGLASSPWSSGAVSRDQGIQRSGNPRARRTAIELAGLWLRHQPDSALARWFHERVGAGKRRIRRTMIVALARKLIVALWRYLTQGLLPEGAIPKPDKSSTRGTANVTCDEAGWVWTGAPQGFQCRQKDGSHPPGLAKLCPCMRDMGAGSREPTGYEVMWTCSAIRREADPDYVRKGLKPTPLPLTRCASYEGGRGSARTIAGICMLRELNRSGKRHVPPDAPMPFLPFGLATTARSSAELRQIQLGSFDRLLTIEVARCDEARPGDLCVLRSVCFFMVSPAAASSARCRIVTASVPNLAWADMRLFAKWRAG